MRNKWTKWVAFLLAVVLSGASVWMVTEASLFCRDKDVSPEVLLDPYAWVDTMLYGEHQTAANLACMAYQFGSRENVLAGGSVSDDEIVQRLYEEYYTGASGGEAVESEALDKKTRQAIETGIRSYLRSDYGYDEENNEWLTSEVKDFMSWLDNNPTCYEQARQKLINDDLDSWNAMDTQLKEERNNEFLYCAYAKRENDNVFLTNTDETNRKKAEAAVLGCPVVLQMDPQTGRCEYSWNAKADPIRDQLSNRNGRWRLTVYDLPESSDMEAYASEYASENVEPLGGAVQEDDVLVVGIRSNVFEKYLYNDYKALYRPLYWYAAGFVLCLLGVLLCMILLICGAGKTPEDNTVRLHPADRIWSEIYWAVGLGGFFLCLAAAMSWLGEVLWNITSPMWMAQLVPTLFGMLAAIICLPCLLSQVRRIKARKFWDGFACIWSLKWLWSQWKRGPLFVKVISAAVILPIACAMWVPVPFVILGLLWFGVKMAKRLQAILDGAKRIRAGETGAHIDVTGGHELEQLADDLNGISDGLQHAVETAVQSERLKSELISNVSHDLKTPLTGIITYVDLMKRLEPGDPKMQSYLNVVDQKAARLSTLVNDLLDASKASSGAMKTELTRVNFRALFQQACGEMQEKLDAAGLDIRLKTTGRTDVQADGRLLWRVLDNLLNNCARYAMPHSRVYVELTEQGRWCVLTMKNTSAQELNISAEELMERFTRGDRARNTEGSGLGLNIAKSLTELMHGTFSLTVDGDLFKVQVFMPLWIPSAQEQYTQPLPKDFDPDQTQKIR